jgi:uncharacterized membrane protein (UPF0127 family)
MQPHDLDPPDARVRILRWVIAGLMVVGFGACIAKGANNPADPKVVQARIPGFGEIGIRISAAGQRSASATRCALLAATEKQRAQGLMRITDLRGYQGMVFRFATDTQSGFYMKDTPMPLSIAWFAADGRFVSSADMPPCGNRADCPIFGATAAYRYALEVPQGTLRTLGIGPGSVLQLTGAC